MNKLSAKYDDYSSSIMPAATVSPCDRAINRPNSLQCLKDSIASACLQNSISTMAASKLPINLGSFFLTSPVDLSIIEISFLIFASIFNRPL